MKIVSKFKDYYDFAAGYDPDPRKVYNRNPTVCDTNISYRDNPVLCEIIWRIKHFTGRRGNYFTGGVLFCDKYYQYFYNSETGNYYYRNEDIPPDVKKGFISLDPYPSRWEKKYDIIENDTGWYEKERIDGVPVMYSILAGDDVVILMNGRLADIKFGSVKPPQEAYQELYNWIEFREPETDSSPTNMNRFESKGFDKKTSFRKVK